MCTFVLTFLFLPMNDRDRHRLAVLQDFFQQRRYLPAFEEIRKLLEVRSKSAVSRLVARLKDEDYLQASETGRLVPGRRFFERPVITSVNQRGEESGLEFREAVSIDQLLIKAPSKTVLIKVPDDGMRDAGILGGDWAVVQRGAPCNRQDVVVGIVDDHFIVRFLAVDEQTGEFFLRPANPTFTDIHPKHELELFGRVLGTFRSY